MQKNAAQFGLHFSFNDIFLKRLGRTNSISFPLNYYHTFAGCNQ